MFNALQAKFRAACQGGPITAVQPDGVWYYKVTAENMDRIIDEHLKDGRVVAYYVFNRQGRRMTPAQFLPG